MQYGCVALRIRFFSQNFGTIKWILPGSSSPSHREGPGTEVGLRFTISCLVIDRWWKIRYAAFDSSHSTPLFYAVNVLHGEWMLIVCCVCAHFAQFVSDWCFNNSHANSHDLLLVIAIDFTQRMFYKSIRFACLRCTRFMFYKFQTC